DAEVAAVDPGSADPGERRTVARPGGATPPAPDRASTSPDAADAAAGPGAATEAAGEAVEGDLATGPPIVATPAAGVTSGRTGPLRLAMLLLGVAALLVGRERNRVRGV
ncbi:MAG: hypothetical protein IH998_09645, partial [Proteobacteria bacterium]|nr:hypothetical protein [Pseudomonadota bacterium]